MKPFENDNYTGRNQDGMHPNMPVRLLTASTIIGDKVYNDKDEDMGRIKDIMLDLEYGRIEYVIIEFGGFLGIGEKFFAIPFSVLEVDPKRRAFLFKEERRVLEKAPGFDKHHWPETNDHTWQEANSYWGDFMGPNTGGF